MKLLLNAPRCDHPERILEVARNCYTSNHTYGVVLEPGDMTRYEFDLFVTPSTQDEDAEFMLRLNNCGGGIIPFSVEKSSPLCQREYRPMFNPTEQIEVCHRWDLVEANTLEGYGYVKNGNAHTASILGTFIAAYLAFHYSYDLAGTRYTFDDVELY